MGSAYLFGEDLRPPGILPRKDAERPKILLSLPEQGDNNGDIFVIKLNGADGALEWAGRAAGLGSVRYHYPVQPGWFYDLDNDDVIDDLNGDGILEPLGAVGIKAALTAGSLGGWQQIPVAAQGAVQITIGGANIQTLSDNWYLARYKGLPICNNTTDSGQFGFGTLAPTIFNFQNQSASLLEEELILLRGRDDRQGPTAARPVYNRYFWNFTQGDGEVAYALSYNVSDQNGDGFLNEFDARIMYPQGHGDAWGHYLTAAKTYYELLRPPFYTWNPRPEAVPVRCSPTSIPTRLTSASRRSIAKPSMTSTRSSPPMRPSRARSTKPTAGSTHSAWPRAWCPSTSTRRGSTPVKPISSRFTTARSRRSTTPSRCGISPTSSTACCVSTKTKSTT